MRRKRLVLNIFVFTSLVFACSASQNRSSHSSTSIQCLPSASALTNIRSYFAYYDRDTPEHRVEQFSTVSIGERVFLRHNNPVVPTYPNVFVYDPSFTLQPAVDCPTDETWVPCVVEWEKTHNLEAPREPSCDFDLMVPEWTPSLDTEGKRQLATEPLREFRQHSGGADDLKELYVRDFNADDPHIDFYAVGREGLEFFQGCGFDGKRTPHCDGWHLYGQAPLDELKQNVLKQSYR